MDFGKIIKEARIRQGMTQLQLAEEIGYTQWTILHWEKGTRRMTLEAADKVFKALHISVQIGEEKQDDKTNFV